MLCRKPIMIPHSLTGYMLINLAGSTEIKEWHVYSDYGFIVDYLAEILMSCKEDRTNEYSKYFELSDTILQEIRLQL
jgi:predicted ATP-dependent Lon-type protease